MPSLHPRSLPSPCPTEDERNTSVQPDQYSTTSTTSMLKIDSLLNPSTAGHGRLRKVSVSPPPTPAYTIQTSSGTSTPQPQTPNTSSSSKRQKLIKDGAIFIPGTPKEPVIYPPFESNEPAICLSPSQRLELARMHDAYDVTPRGTNGQGLIADFQRHIPYSSERRTFSKKTNKNGFEAFTYTFRMPGEDKKYVVMWDYQDGLVRITPFFKALKHSKTTPAKALTSNRGLKELSYSITGGALVAQGYWMPYSCARALCLTFCFDIRWVLTPLFGPSFIKECLPSGDPPYCHPQFGSFLISSEIVRCAQLQAEGTRSEVNTPSGTPIINRHGQAGGPVEIPRSVPAPVVAGKQLRPRREQPTFREGSPFDSRSETSDRDYTYNDADDDSMAVSPKSTPRSSGSPAWNSINRRNDGATAATASANTSHGTLAQSLLTQPRYTPSTSRHGTPAVTSALKKTVKMPTGSHDKHRTHKRRISKLLTKDDGEYIDSADNRSSSGDSSESDDVDIVVTPAVMTTGKRARRVDTPTASTSPPPPPPPSSTPTASSEGEKYLPEDIRAAYHLINLSMRDAQLARSPKKMRGKERRLSSI